MQYTDDVANNTRHHPNLKRPRRLARQGGETEASEFFAKPRVLQGLPRRDPPRRIEDRHLGQEVLEVLISESPYRYRRPRVRGLESIRNLDDAIHERVVAAEVPE